MISIFKERKLKIKISTNLDMKTQSQENFIDFNNVDWTICIQVDILSENVQSIDNLADVYENLTQTI